MSILQADETEYTFTSSVVDAAAWQVESFSGVEELSRPFMFRVVLVSRDGELDLDAPVGQAARLSILGLTGTRHIHGVIERFEQRSLGRKWSYYEATLVPTLYPLKYTRNSRIFQHKSTLDIVKKVLQDAGYAVGQVLIESLRGKYGPRDYCVQYQESDYDFIARLLEEEGIFYFFEHHEDKDVMVLGDGKHAIEAVPGAATLRYLDESPETARDEEAIIAFQGESVIRPGGTVMRDFRFKQPGMDLEAQQQADKFQKLQVYYYPGEYVESEMGQRLAKVRLEELQWDRQRYIGGSTSRAVLPGYKFTLAGHPRGKFNQEYLLVAVEQRGSQPAVLGEEAGASQRAARAYQSRVVCIPSGVVYRPHRVTPRPNIFGVQSAVVVGPPGEEIHCDEHGRVKVQFHWDREGKRTDDSSCWIRVSQPWGGAGQGGMFIPRVTQEVLVQFLEGDPDRPVIVGRVYNGENPVPHGLPGAKMISTIRSSSYPGGGGFNEIKFDDSKGKEEMFVNAQYDRNETTGHDHTFTVTNDQTITVNGKQTQTVKKDQSLTVTEGNQTESVVAGLSSLTVKQDRSVTVESGNHNLTVQTGTSNHTVKSDRNVTVQSGTENVTIQTGSANLTVKTDRNVTVQSGHYNVTTAAGSIAITANTDAALTSNTANVRIGAKVNLEATAGTKASISAPDVDIGDAKIKVHGTELVIEGSTSILLKVGASEISIKSSEISIKSPKISKTAEGNIELTASLIKLN